MTFVDSSGGSAASARRGRRRPLLPTTVRVPSWLVSSVVFSPTGEAMDPVAIAAEEDTRRVRFWRGDVRWRPSVAVLDLVLAVQRLHAWSAMPDSWKPYAWRSLAVAMVPSLEGVPQAPPLPGGFHEKYSGAMLEASELKVSARRADGQWSAQENFVEFKTCDWGGRSAVRGRRVFAVQFARCFEDAVSGKSAAGLNLVSYYSLHGSHLRLAFVLGTAAAAHHDISAKSPAPRSSDFFLPACGYADGSWAFGAWEYRLCERVADRIGGLRLANGSRLRVAVQSGIQEDRGTGRRHFAKTKLLFWAESTSGGTSTRNISRTEARIRDLIGHAEVDRRLGGAPLDDDELETVKAVYFRAGKAGQEFARDRGHWTLLAKLLGEARDELRMQVRLLMEEVDTSPTSNFRQDLAARDLVKVAVHRVRKRVFYCATIAQASRGS